MKYIEINKIGKAAKMSNLVGMYAFLVKEDKIEAVVFVAGKEGDNHFICQLVDPLTFEPNVAKLMTIDQLKDWVILPNAVDAQNALYDYRENGWWRYSVSF
jgi:hypothetical protein